MVAYGEVITACLLGVGVSLIAWRWQQQWQAAKSLDSVPSPPGKWLVGNAPELIKAGSQGRLSSTLLQWMQQYGPLVAIRIFQHPILMVAKPQLMEWMLTEGQQQGMVTRSPRFYGAFADVFGVHVVNQTGDAWKWRRQAAVPGFRASQFTKKLDLIQEACQQVITDFKEAANAKTVVEVDSHFLNLTLNIIAYFLLGVDFQRTQNFVGEPPFEADRTYAALAVLEKNVLLQSAGRNWWLKFLPTPAGREYQQAQAYLRQTFQPRVDMALQIARGSQEETPAIGDSFRHSILVKLAQKPQHDRESLMAEVRAMIFAGHDTTAHTLSFAVGELGLNPAIMQKAQQIVDEAWAKEGELNLRTLENLGYIEALVKETMRLYPVVTNIPLISTQKIELDGISIPKHCGIELFFWAGGRDAQMYPNPEAFQPERWLKKDGEQEPAPLMFGFSLGAHLCLGASLAMLEATVMLSLLLRYFTWELVKGRESLEDVNQYITIFPRDRMPVRFSLRTVPVTAPLNSKP